MVRSNLMDAVTYQRRNQKLGIIIKKLKRAAKGASIKKKHKERWNTPKTYYKNYLSVHSTRQLRFLPSIIVLKKSLEEVACI